MKNEFMNSDMENDLINYESTDCDDVNTNDFMNSDMENELINVEELECQPIDYNGIYDDLLDDNGVYNNLPDDDEEEFGDFEELAEKIALEEEIKRIERAEVSLDDFLNQLDLTNSDLSDREGTNGLKEYTLSALGIVASFKILLQGGIDYQNAIQIANNIYQNKANEKQVSIQNTILEQNTI